MCRQRCGLRYTQSEQVGGGRGWHKDRVVDASVTMWIVIFEGCACQFILHGLEEISCTRKFTETVALRLSCVSVKHQSVGHNGHNEPSNGLSMICCLGQYLNPTTWPTDLKTSMSCSWDGMRRSSTYCAGQHHYLLRPYCMAHSQLLRMSQSSSGHIP